MKTQDKPKLKNFSFWHKRETRIDVQIRMINHFGLRRIEDGLIEAEAFKEQISIPGKQKTSILADMVAANLSGKGLLHDKKQ
jgi:hypothetical protein